MKKKILINIKINKKYMNIYLLIKIKKEKKNFEF